MSEKLSIEPGKTAVLIMDYQTDIIGLLGTNQQDLLKRASQVLQASRDAKVVVIKSSNVGSGRCETDRRSKHSNSKNCCWQGFLRLRDE